MKKSVITGAAFLLAVGAVQAADVTWTGGGDGTLYTNGANWGGTAPADDLTTDIAVLTGGTVDLDTTRQVSGLNFSSGSTLSGSGSIQVGTGGITVGGNSTIGTTSLVMSNAVGVTLNGTLDISSALVGNGDLTFTAGTATDVTLSGNSGNDNSSSYSGNLTFDGVNASLSRYAIAGGGEGLTLSLLNGSSLSALNSHLVLGNRDIIISGGAKINQYGSNNIYRFGGVVSGTGGLTYGNVGGGNGDKIQVDGLANTYTGGTTIDNTDVHIKGDGGLGDSSGGITLKNGGKLVTLNNMDLGSRAITLDTGGGILGLNGKTVTAGGVISGSEALTVNGGGTLNITADSTATFSGDINIDSSTVKAGRNTIALDSGSANLNLSNGGEISASGNHLDLTGRNIVVDSTGGTIRHAHARNIYGMGSTVISGDGELTMAGSAGSSDAGRIQLQGANTYTGGTRIIDNAQAWAYSDASFGAAGTSITFDSDDGGDYYAANGVDLGSRAIVLQGGGAEFKLNNKTTTIGGTISGTSALTTTGSGTLVVQSTANTYSGGTTINIGTVQIDGDASLGTGDITLDNGGRLKNDDSAPVLANNVIIGSGGGEVMAGWNKSLTLNGALSGSGGLTVVADSGTVYLNGDSSGFTGLLNVENGAKLGGSGTINGDLTITAGGTLAFSTTDTLTVGGAVTLDSTFGIDDLDGISSAIADGTYTLVAGDVSASFLSGFENIGEANAYDLGDGKSAYFQEGSLQVVVIPEPATLGMIALFGGGILFIRRRFMI